MGCFWSFHWAMSCEQIQLRADSDANFAVGDPPRIKDTVLAIDWIVLIVCPFLGDRL